VTVWCSGPPPCLGRGTVQTTRPVIASSPVSRASALAWSGDHGHGSVPGPRLLDDKPTAREFYDQLTALYPDRLNPGVVWLGARALLGG
jgi:hypothetical protein